MAKKKTPAKIDHAARRAAKTAEWAEYHARRRARENARAEREGRELPHKPPAPASVKPTTGAKEPAKDAPPAKK